MPLIDIQAAIDAIVAWTVEDRPDIEMPTDLINRIKNIPSAQPEIIRCKDCKRYTKYISYCEKLGISICDDDFCSFAERRTDG